MKVHNPNKLPTIPIADLLATQGDLKDLTEENYNKLKGNIERRGFIDPVAIWEDSKGIKHLLNGHQRQRVLTKEGWNEPIPYFNIPAKSLQEAAAIVLELTSQFGTITQEGVDTFIAKYELNEAEVYSATSFDALAFSKSEEEPEIEEDEPPEVSSEPPVSQLGSIYQLGRHRVMCADSTVKENVEKLMDGNKADVAITDPPYGINIVQNNSVGGRKLAKVTKYSPIENDDGVEVAHKAIEIMKETTENQIVFGGNYFADKLEPKMCWVVWDKDNTGNFADCELAWTSYDKAAKLYKVTWNGMIREGESGQRVHPTQKPIKLFGYIIKDFDPQSVQDLFLGSGSTLIACEQTDRTCFGMELDCKYLDVVRKRWAKYVYPDRWEEEWEQLTPAIET